MCSGTMAGVSNDGRVAIVTGAARGIGAAVAHRLAASGWRLVLVDICADDPVLPYPLATEEQLEAVVAACGRDVAVPVVGDVRVQADLDRAVSVAVETFDGLDAAVAVAGCLAGGTPSWSLGEDIWRTVLGVNLEGVWRLASAAVPALLERAEPRSGRFVAVSSTAGTLGLPRLAAYAAAKHGVVGLVKSMAAELGPTGVTANVVAPGSTATAMLQASAAVYDLEDTNDFAQHHLLGRLVQPAEVASLIAWLCGTESSGVTGAVLSVDGGMTAS